MYGISCVSWEPKHVTNTSVLLFLHNWSEYGTTVMLSTTWCSSTAGKHPFLMWLYQNNILMCTEGFQGILVWYLSCCCAGMSSHDVAELFFSLWVENGHITDCYNYLWTKKCNKSNVVTVCNERERRNCLQYFHCWLKQLIHHWNCWYYAGNWFMASGWYTE